MTKSNFKIYFTSIYSASDMNLKIVLHEDTEFRIIVNEVTVPIEPLIEFLFTTRQMIVSSGKRRLYVTRPLLISKIRQLFDDIEYDWSIERTV